LDEGIDDTSVSEDGNCGLDEIIGVRSQIDILSAADAV
jgi:hypothetical protein